MACCGGRRSRGEPKKTFNPSQRTRKICRHCHGSVVQKVKEIKGVKMTIYACSMCDKAAKKE